MNCCLRKQQHHLDVSENVLAELCPFSSWIWKRPCLSTWSVPFSSKTLGRREISLGPQVDEFLLHRELEGYL
jgi:hypothetical protein